MLEQKVIITATTEWAAPIVFVSVKYRFFCVCMDYRDLHPVTQRGSYAILLMNECIESIEESKISSMFDAKSGYWKSERDEKVKNKTAFKSHRELCGFKQIPFCAKIAPRIFQRATDVILVSMKWLSAMVYYIIADFHFIEASIKSMAMSYR